MRGRTLVRPFLMPDTAEIAKAIAEIDELLNAGVTNHAIDGTSTAYDVDSLRRQRADLVARLAGCRPKLGCVPVRMD